jgi:hypothetical protein
MKRLTRMLQMLTNEQRKEVPGHVINELSNKTAKCLRNVVTGPSIADTKHL